MSLAEFFSMEAGDYLERLDALVSAAAGPDPEELVRLTRALRGSALMAKQSAIAAAAGGLEHVARAVKENRLSWDEATKQLAIRAVDDLKIFVRKVGDWSETDEAKARAVAAELNGAAGVSTTPESTPAVVTLDSSTRAFIGREGAAVASALDQAAKGLQQNPTGYEPLRRVLTVMQPLRGLAVLAELPPMPDLLEGVERAVGAITERSEPTDGAALLFNAAAKALSRGAQEIATEGTPDSDSPEARDFAHRLGAILEAEADIVPISSLYFDDAGPHILEHGTAPARPGVLGRIELVSHGDHLRLAADELERARSPTQRDLRAQALAATFRALASAAGGPLLDMVAKLGVAARDAVGRGAAAQQTSQFALQLREAGVALAETGQADEQQLVQRLSAIVGTLEQLEGAPVAAAPEPTHGPLSRPPADSVAIPTPPDLSPRRYGAAPPAPAAPAGGAGGAGEAVGAAGAAGAGEVAGAAGVARAAGREEKTPNLVGSWARYERYVAALGLGEPSLETLLAGPPADPSAAPATAAAPAPAGEAAGAAAGIVPIRSLCYTGDAALQRAHDLREQVRAALSAGGTDGSALSDLLEEIFDLVELSRTDKS